TVINNDFARLQTWVFFRRLPEDLEEQPVRQLQDVCFVDAVHGLAFLALGPVKSETEEPPAGSLRDHLDAPYNAWNELMLGRGIQILGQFADDEQGDAAKPGRQPAQVLERPHRSK